MTFVTTVDEEIVFIKLQLDLVVIMEVIKAFLHLDQMVNLIIKVAYQMA